MAAFGPRERIGLDFAGATLDAAQHPFGGVAKVGARMSRFVLDGVMTPAEVANFKPTPEEMDAHVSVTAAAHRLAGVYGIPRGALSKSVPFAYEGLVLAGGIVCAGDEFRKGEDGRVLEGVSVDGREVSVIDIPTAEQREGFAELAANPAKLTEFGTALGNIATMAANPMHAAQDPIAKYHAELTSVSARYASDPSDPGRMAGLGAARDQLTVDMRPHLLNALPAGMGDVAGAVLVENVLRNNPTGALVQHYFAPPQA